jgi:putative tryptophan/tyrosine transport system substrate-binding protein
MRRRDFTKGIVGSVAAWPLAAHAQQQPQGTRRVGILMTLPQNDPETQRRVAAFVQGLRGLGWTDGANLQIDYRWPGSDVDRVRAAAVELLDLKPDAILAETSLAVAPLQRLTSTVPIVFVQFTDPVGSGAVATLARPGGNITGFTPNEFSTSAKMLEVLREIAPQVTEIAVIYNPVQVPQVEMWRAIETAAPALSVEVIAASAGNADEIKNFIEGFAGKSGSGIIVLPNPVTNASRRLIIELMARHRLPAIYAYSYFVREGGLVSYGVDPAEQYLQAASYVDRILKGAKPGDLPVQQSMKFYLTINLKTARALGLTISRDFLLVADEVIE